MWSAPALSQRRHGRRTPHRTQSGRRRFVKTRHELRLEVGTFPVRDDVEDSGTYEIIEYDDRRYDLWFTGEKLRGRWLLEKVNRSWSLAPVPTRATYRRSRRPRP
jgi:hypothetical protein